MISDVLSRLALLKRQIPEDEFETKTAIEAAIDDTDRELTEDERAELDALMPGWLEDGSPEGIEDA